MEYDILHRHAKRMAEIQRISGSPFKIATSFKFEPANVNIQEDYIACDFPKLIGDLEESQKTLEEAKKAFAKWLNDHGFLKKKGMFTSLVRPANWDVNTNDHSLVIGIRLDEIGRTYEEVKDIMEGKYDESIIDRKQELEEFSNMTSNEIRKTYGKQLMQRLLNNWN